MTATLGYDEMVLDNLLMNQKDVIYRLVRSEEYNRAVDMLFVVQDLWVTCHYGYKGRELTDLMAGRLKFQLECLVPQATRQRRELQTTLDRVQELRDYFYTHNAI